MSPLCEIRCEVLRFVCDRQAISKVKSVLSLFFPHMLECKFTAEFSAVLGIN